MLMFKNLNSRKTICPFDMNDKEEKEYKTFEVDEVLSKFIQVYVDEMNVCANRDGDNWSYLVSCSMKTDFEPRLDLEFPELPFSVIARNFKQLTSLPFVEVNSKEKSEDSFEAELVVNETATSVIGKIFE